MTLDRLLAKEPGQRYQSFREVRTDISQLLQDASGLTPVPQGDPAAATAAVGRTPFIGRESERTEARQLLDQAVTGQGTVLLVGGEPGVGKTRLAEEVLADDLLAQSAQREPLRQTHPLERLERFGKRSLHLQIHIAIGADDEHRHL